MLSGIVKDVNNLGLMQTEKVLTLLMVILLVGVVAHAQSRFDVCRQMRQKTISCVLSF
jgi:hypothetical protein